MLITHIKGLIAPRIPTHEPPSRDDLGLQVNRTLRDLSRWLRFDPWSPETLNPKASFNLKLRMPG